MDRYLADFFRHLSLERNASAYTVKSYREDLTQALECWRILVAAEVTPIHLTTRLVRRYVVWLHEQGYSPATAARRMAAVRTFFKFLCRQGVLTTNPAQGVRSPKLARKLPKFLAPAEVDSLLDQPQENDTFSCRDKAILEVFYSGGVRVGELVALNIVDLNLDEGYARVRGKGRRERLVLLGDPSIRAIQHWMQERQGLPFSAQSDALFLNRFGKRLTTRSIGRLVQKYTQRAGLSAEISPHSIRHTFATHMLDAGAEIRSVQELLGHQNLTTTQLYTHVSTQKLQEQFRNAHPRA